jgi:tetratricopeptide (TPR) repeat protein
MTQHAIHLIPAFDSLWDYSHPDVTKKTFRALLPLAEKSGDLSYLLQLKTQIARCEGLQAKFGEAHAILDEVEPQLTDAVSVARVRYLLERGRVFNSSDYPDKARPLFIDAWNQANAANEFGFAIDAAHMIAIVDPDLDVQVEWNRKGLELIDQHPEWDRWKHSIYNNLGETFRARKEYDKALDCFEKLAQWLRGRGKEPDVFNLKDIARMNRLLDKPHIALPIIEPIAKDLKSKKQPDGYISAEYGLCLIAVERTDDAKPYLIEAYEILCKDPYMLKNEPNELKRLWELAGR